MAITSFLSLTRGRSNVNWMTAYSRSTGLPENMNHGAAYQKTESNDRSRVKVCITISIWINYVMDFLWFKKFNIIGLSQIGLSLGLRPNFYWHNYP